jgi:hypothetical protein
MRQNNKMKYHWEGNSDTFKNVLVHEKTHLKKMAKLIVGEK